MNNSVAGEQAFSTPPNEIAVYSLTLKVIDWYTLNRNLRFPRSTKAINAYVQQQNIARNCLIVARNVGPLCKPVRCCGSNESMSTCWLHARARFEITHHVLSLQHFRVCFFLKKVPYVAVVSTKMEDQTLL